MDVKWSGMNLNPVVVIQKLSEEDVKFYTRRAPNRRSGRRKKERSYNLKDEQHVDFSFFEEYRRSRTTYLKKKERKKRVPKSTKQKKAAVDKKVPIVDVSQLTSNQLGSLVLGCNVVNKVNSTTVLKKPKKSNTGAKAKNKNSSKKKFKRMVIESDSDCSVENYGIVYCNEGSLPFSNSSSNSISNSFSQHAFASGSLLFNSSMQTKVSCSPNISPPCSEVIVNEKDILSALDCDADDEFYNKVIKDKIPTLSRYKKLDSSELLDYLSGNSKDGNKCTVDQQLHESSEITATCLPAFARLNEENSSNTNKHHGAMPTLLSVGNNLQLKRKCETDDVIKQSCDVVSKIMEDMDQEFQKRKKKQCTFDITYGSNLSNCVAKSSISALTNKTLNPINQRTVNSLTHSSSKSNANNTSVDQDISALMEKLISDVCALSSIKSRWRAIRPKPSTKLVKHCSKCHKSFMQSKEGKSLCRACEVSCFESELMPSKETTQNEQNQVSKRSKVNFSHPKTAFRGRLSTLMLKKTSCIRSKVVKKLTSGDRHRLLYKKAKVKENHKSIPQNNKSETDQYSSTSAVDNCIKSTESFEASDKEVCKSIEQSGFKKSSKKISKWKVKVGVEKKKGKNIVISKNNSTTASQMNSVGGKTCVDTNTALEAASQLKTDKNGFTLKNIEKGLVLMTFPEPDNELDMSFESPEDEPGNEGNKNEQTQKECSRDSNKQLTTVTPQQVVPSRQMNDIECRYVLPTGPTIVAHYSKADQRSSDFHLSKITYKKPSEQQCLPAAADCKMAVLDKDSSNCSSANNAERPKSTSKSNETDISNTSMEVVPFLAAKSVFSESNLKPPGVQGTSPNPPKESQMSSAINRVLHELDAFAILSILDLDGNEQHATNLLENILMKEIGDLQDLTELCHENVEDNVKNIAASKSHATAGRIRSLNIARSLLKKYGKLSNIIKAILDQSVSKIKPNAAATTVASTATTFASTVTTVTSTPTSTVSVSNKSVEQSSQLVPYIHRISKPEKSALSDCALAKANNTETGSSLRTTVSQHSSVQNNLFTSEAATNVQANITVKSEALQTSSSCMMSVMPVASQQANSREYGAQSTFLSPDNRSQSAGSVHDANPFILSNLNGPNVLSNQNSPVDKLPSANVFRSTTPKEPVTTPVASVPISPSVVRGPHTASPLNIKGENQMALSSCQLQGQNAAKITQFNYADVPPTSVAHHHHAAQNSLVPYRAILPANVAPKAPCPNKTVPFSNPLQAMGMSRNLNPMNYVGNNTQGVTSNPLMVQQVVLSNMGSARFQPQNTFSVAPYNYVMQQQPAGNTPLIPQQPMSNFYAIYPSAATNSQPLVAPQLQNIGISTPPNAPLGNVMAPTLKCIVCSNPPTMRCKQCAKVLYCNTECAKIYWNQRHKLECKMDPRINPINGNSA